MREVTVVFQTPLKWDDEEWSDWMEEQWPESGYATVITVEQEEV